MDTDSSDEDSDYDSDDDFDTDNLANIERICDDDYFDSQLIDKKWYIGLSFKQNNYFIYLIHISPSSFLKYSYEIVHKYLRRYSCTQLPKDIKIELMQMHFVNKTLGGSVIQIKRVVLKTYWIKLIQRCWRNTLKRRKEMIICWSSYRNRKYAEITGRNLPEYRYLPGLVGCIKNK